MSADGSAGRRWGLPPGCGLPSFATYSCGDDRRELRRNRTHHDGSYRPQLADRYGRGRRSRSRRNQRFSPADWATVHTRIREDWSPEQIAGRLRLETGLAISHETIYRSIWADKVAGGTLHTHLRGARKQRRKR